MKKNIIAIIVFLIIFNKNYLSFAKDICNPLRSYSIDVVSDIMDDSLKWQKNFNTKIHNSKLFPLTIEKIIFLRPYSEVSLYIKNEKIYYDYIPKAKYLIIKYDDNNQFFIKRDTNKNFRKVSKDFLEKYGSYTIKLDKNKYSGIIIISNTKNMIKIKPNFYLLSIKYVYLCKINIEHPFKKVDIHVPDSYLSETYIVGNIIFDFDGKLYKLNIFKDFDNKLFTFYYEGNSKIPKFIPIIRRKGSYYILDFNKSFYHFCIYNKMLDCPDDTIKAYSSFLPINAGQKE